MAIRTYADGRFIELNPVQGGTASFTYLPSGQATKPRDVVNAVDAPVVQVTKSAVFADMPYLGGVMHNSPKTRRVRLMHKRFMSSVWAVDAAVSGLRFGA
jgi:hypothetical protein